MCIHCLGFSGRGIDLWKRTGHNGVKTRCFELRAEQDFFDLK